MKKRILLCLFMVFSLGAMTACGDGDIPLPGFAEPENVEKPLEVIVEPLGTPTPETAGGTRQGCSDTDGQHHKTCESV